ncbi:hypothetical protein TNCV_2775101 [Trichonephila clavipes]|nr:hypothetical protein TNCV_2775101 [Trichonephila clavipes]
MDHAATSKPSQIQSVTQFSVSTRTIQHRLQQSGMFTRRPLLHLPFSGNNRHFPRLWCDEQWTWTMVWNDHVTEESASVCNITLVGFEFGDTKVKGY